MSDPQFEAPCPCPACGAQFATRDESSGLPRCPTCRYTRIVDGDDLTCPNCGGWLYDAVLLRSDTSVALCGYCRVVLPDPPERVTLTPQSPEAVGRRPDRDFYDRLGDESPSQKCDDATCERGRITNGVYCRRHHFEMMRRKPCPFED